MKFFENIGYWMSHDYVYLEDNDFHEAFVAHLSGIADMNGEKEIWWEDKYDDEITIEFVYDNIFWPHAIVRRYYFDGSKKWEGEYREGRMHGPVTWWDKEGKISQEETWEYGYKIYPKLSSWRDPS